MFYALLKSIHFLSYVVWVGGMFFTLVCLRPALPVIDGPARLKLMGEVLRRFFIVVGNAIGLMLLSGIAMLAMTLHGADAGRVPLAWHVMIGLGIVMIAVYGYLRANLFVKFQRAAQSGDSAAAVALLGKIRAAVGINIALGVVVALAMRGVLGL